MKILVRVISFAALTLAAPAVAETMNNGTVLTLAKAGLGEGLIIDKINSEACGYDVSTNGLISLKAAGLSDNVISAMVRRCTTANQAIGVAGNDSSPDPKIKHSPGIYLMQTWASPAALQLLHPSKSSGMKTSGNGSIAFPLHAILMVPGLQSHITVPTPNPTFYFYFNTSGVNADFGGAGSTVAESPDEFSLVKFNQKAKDGERELDVGKASAFGNSIVSFRKGIDTRHAIKFNVEDNGDGSYKVSPNALLEPGEYAFVIAGENGSSRIYDFSVTNSALPQAPSK